MLTVALALEEGGAVPCISENDGVLWEEVAVVDIVLHQTVRDRFGGSKCRLSIYAHTGGGSDPSYPRTERCDLLPAEDFLCECGHVGKLRLVIERWQAISAYDAIDLLLRLGLGRGVHQHGEEEGQQY